VTKDLRRSRDFYERLGCRIAEEAPEGDFMIDLGPLQLSIVSESEHHKYCGGGAFLFFDAPNLDEVEAVLKEQNIEHKRIRARRDFITTHDPDGYELLFGV
jgi:catechol 2,3-dioxygenase-like lactoylglutathione lyase family enzyme